MKLTGRTEEQQILKQLHDSDHAEFLAIYGRRRIGKTYLIKHFFTKKGGVFFHVTGIKDGNLREQLAAFIKAIGLAFYKSSEIKERLNWFDAFAALTDAIKKHAEKSKKIVIFLDELPWMATHKSKLLQALDHYWNHYWSDDTRIKLIICGSSASWIINKIINNKGGLHNRVTKKILLKPFTLQETKQFLSARGFVAFNQGSGGLNYRFLRACQSDLGWLLDKVSIINAKLFGYTFSNNFPNRS